MARVAKKPAEQGRKGKDCEPKDQESYYTDLMDIEGKHGESDYFPHIIDLNMGKGMVPRVWNEWYVTQAHGSEGTNHGNMGTESALKKLEGGINGNSDLDNGQFMCVGVYSTTSNGAYSKQIGRGAQAKQLAMSPMTAWANRGDPQQRVPNFSNNLQRTDRHPPLAHCRERASGTIDLYNIIGILNNIIGFGFWHRIVLAISLITIGRLSMDRRRMTPLRRDAEWPLAAWMWRLHGARPEAAKTRADSIINVIIPTKMPKKEMGKLIGKLNMGIMNKVRVVNGALAT